VTWHVEIVVVEMSLSIQMLNMGIYWICNGFEVFNRFCLKISNYNASWMAIL
jgi:hypothetical protein